MGSWWCIRLPLSVLRTIRRTLLILLVNPLGVLLFDSTMVLVRRCIQLDQALLSTFQSILIALIYLNIRKLKAAGAVVIRKQVLPAGNLADNAKFHTYQISAHPY